MIGNSVIMELIADCVRWHYESYDHKAAVEELKINYNHSNSNSYYPEMFESKFTFVPDDLKEKYAHMKTGKLRSLKFDPDGMIAVMYVGRNHRYAKSFLPSQVGVKLKPILNKNDDKFGLIKAGLGVDESSLIL